jgi:hypothetical protein
MARDFDLLGDPIPEGRGLQGRTGHIPTSTNAKKIRLLLIAKWTIDAIAEEIGISAPTLRKHYFRNGKINLGRAREIAVQEVRGRTLLQLDKAAEAGNVSAIKEIRRIADVADVSDLPKAMTPAKAPRLGKKEMAAKDAQQPDSRWQDLLAPHDAQDLPN